MLFTPEQFILLGVVLLGGLLIGYACAPSPRKWKRRVREQSESFTEHYAALEEQLRAANQRIDDLSAQNNALRADNVEAERTIGSLRAAAMAAPVVAEPAKPALPPVEPTPVAEGEWTPVAAGPAPVVAEAAGVAASTGHAPADTGPVAQDAEPVIEPVAEPPRHDALVEAAHPVPAQAAEASHEVPEGASATGDTFPVVAHGDTSGETVAPLPADSAPTGEAPLTPEPEPVIAHPEPVAVAPMTPVPTDAPPAPIGPAEPEMPSKGWFASSARDDLTRIRGIDGVLNTRLFSLGVTRFEDLEKLSAEDEMALEQRLTLPVGYIAREQWRTQSALLRAGQTEEHAAHFGAAEHV